MRRRSLLASVPLALAGCAHPTNGALSMGEMTTDAAIADRYAGETEGLPPERKALLDAAIADEVPTREGTRPPYDRDRPVEYEGAYYQISHEIVDSHTETLYDVRIDYDPAEPPSSVIDYGDLPAADKNALGDLIPGPDDVPDNEGVDMGRTYRYPADAESVLLDGEYDGVRDGGQTYRVVVEANREVTVNTYEYSAERVADSPADLAQQLRDRYLFTLSGLSEAERGIVETAIEESYFPDETTDAFQSLIDRFRAHDALDGDEYGGDWLVRYDGTVYWVDLQYPPDVSA